LGFEKCGKNDERIEALKKSSKQTKYHVLDLYLCPFKINKIKDMLFSKYYLDAIQ
jgi:hypothetical protein